MLTKCENVLYAFSPTLKRKASGCYESCLYSQLWHFMLPAAVLPAQYISSSWHLPKNNFSMYRLDFTNWPLKTTWPTNCRTYQLEKKGRNVNPTGLDYEYMIASIFELMPTLNATVQKPLMLQNQTVFSTRLTHVHSTFIHCL